MSKSPRAPRRSVRAAPSPEPAPSPVEHGGVSDFFRGILDDDVTPPPAPTRSVVTPPPRPAPVEAPPAPAPEPAPTAFEFTEADDDQAAVAGEGEPRRRRRGRRGGRRHRKRQTGEAAASASAEAIELAEERPDELADAIVAPSDQPVEPDDAESPSALVYDGEADDADETVVTAARDLEDDREKPAGRGRRRRGRRGGRGRRRGGSEVVEAETPADVRMEPAADEAADAPEPVFDLDDERDEVFESMERAPLRTVADPNREPVRDGREMVINVADSDECRIATLLNGRLDELHVERVSAVSHVGNIYKGRVTNVEPSIQAAFVDFGLPTHGFLHITDLHPKYFPDHRTESEQVGRKTPRRDRPPIQRCLRRGQEVLVQITKEGIGTKGPTLTTYISVPGRFLVMMPGMNQLGVSRKIEDEETRRQLRDMLSQLTLPPEMGFIMRTAAIDRNKRDLQRDLAYLLRLWKAVEERIRDERAPCELYQESDLVIRTIRDVFDADVKRILCDDLPTAQRIADFLAIASPKSTDTVAHYNGHEPIFHTLGIESEIDKLHSKEVALRCGGSIVIEPTEALVAIDVNSGRFRVPDDPEETAYRVNLEAADEIARQLRLRDLGGLIICDFIDMRAEKHKRALERRLRDALKQHKERAKCLRISRFGIVEMTRQRQRPSISRSVYQECPRCRGAGMVKTAESVTLDVMRAIRVAAHTEGVAIIDVEVSMQVANHLLNRKRRVLGEIEAESGRTLLVRGNGDFAVDEVRYSCTDRRGRETAFPIGRFASAPDSSGAAPLPPPTYSRPAHSGPGAGDSSPGDSGDGRGNGRGRRRSRGGRRRARPGGERS